MTKSLLPNTAVNLYDGIRQSGLTRLAKFYDYPPKEPIVATLSQQLSWSHFVELIKVDDCVKRSFYADTCAQSRWSISTPRERNL